MDTLVPPPMPPPYQQIMAVNNPLMSAISSMVKTHVALETIRPLDSHKKISPLGGSSQLVSS